MGTITAMGRTGATVAAIVVGLGALTGCGGNAAGPDADAVENLQVLEDRVAALEARVGALEGRAPAGEGADGGDPTDPGGGAGAFLGDPGSSVGQQVTVTATVTELVPTTDLGGAFLIAADGAEPVAVVSATPPPPLDPGHRVRVTGTVLRIDEATFEADFGIAPEQLLEDPDGWFEEFGGRVAVSAGEIEALRPGG